MKKITLAILVGTVLGLIDGLLTFFHPEAVAMGMMPAIIAGSTIKGLVTGAIVGAVAMRWQSLPLGIVVGLVVGLILSFLAALAPDPEGRYHFVEIMIPGAVLGLVVGYVSQRYGRPRGVNG